VDSTQKLPTAFFQLHKFYIKIIKGKLVKISHIEFQFVQGLLGCMGNYVHGFIKLVLLRIKMAEKRHGPATFGASLRYRISANLFNSFWDPWETPFMAFIMNQWCSKSELS
jgi:hypothetical protein